jgi:hypothetical protein
VAKDQCVTTGGQTRFSGRTDRAALSHGAR